MDNPSQQIVDRLKQANNILVTVSANPSVDQLSAAIGFTLLLNKMGKHGSAVFSGEVPPVLDFLQPENTLEKNTDSLRDFIIALDKSKADKLRYKVEENHVKIFITPYRTSITEKDLDFSQGDFNVDVVLALGVKDPNDLDQAITTHGRILHDATVISVSTQPGSTLGSINWADETASSLSEMLVSISQLLGTNLLDEQMATAFLTGIVAETDRFSNAKTSAATMNVSSKLMAAGANQQLVATKLQEPEPPVPEPAPEPPAEPEKPAEEKPEEPKPEAKQAEPEAKAVESSDGSLQISHEDGKNEETKPVLPYLDSSEEPEEDELDQIHIDEQGTLRKAEEVIDTPAADQSAPGDSKLVLNPPTLGGTLTASADTTEAPPTNPLSETVDSKPLLTHTAPQDNAVPVPVAVQPLADTLASTDVPPLELPQPMPGATVHVSEEPSLVAAPEAETQQVEQSLADLEKNVQESDQAQPKADVSDARQAVEGALGTSPAPLEPINALNAQPMDLNLGNGTVDTSASVQPQFVAGVDPVAPPPVDPLVPSDMTQPAPGPDPMAGPTVINPLAPPPVPPPMMPPLPGLDDVQPPSADQQTPQAY